MQNDAAAGMFQIGQLITPRLDAGKSFVLGFICLLILRFSKDSLAASGAIPLASANTISSRRLHKSSSPLRSRAPFSSTRSHCSRRDSSQAAMQQRWSPRLGRW